MSTIQLRKNENVRIQGSSYLNLPLLLCLFERVCKNKELQPFYMPTEVKNAEIHFGTFLKFFRVFNLDYIIKGSIISGEKSKNIRIDGASYEFRDKTENYFP